MKIIQPVFVCLLLTASLQFASDNPQVGISRTYKKYFNYIR